MKWVNEYIPDQDRMKQLNQNIRNFTQGFSVPTIKLPKRNKVMNLFVKFLVLYKNSLLKHFQLTLISLGVLLEYIQIQSIQPDILYFRRTGELNYQPSSQSRIG